MQIQTEKLYEVAYLASPDLDEPGVSALKNKIHEQIVKLGGAVREEIPPLRRRLAYGIKKYTHAWLVSECIMLSAGSQKILAKEFRSKENILRYIFVSLTERLYKNLREKKVPQLHTITREAKERVLAKRMPSIALKTEKPPEEKKADIAEIERKLDEILGREL